MSFYEDQNKKPNSAEGSEAQQPTNRDPGIIAKERLKMRVEKAKRAAMAVYLAVATFVTGLTVGIGSYVYNEFHKPARMVTDTRPCLFVDPNTEMRISGRREYNYPARNLFGFTYRNNNEVEVKTILDLKPEAMTVTGISNDNYWTTYSDQGETGVITLDPAMLYVVTLGKNTYIFQDNKFCR